MKVIEIQKGKTFYHLRITPDGYIYDLNKINIDAISRQNIEGIFQIRYTIPNSDKSRYERLYVEESNSPYFIKIGGEKYLTLPNKQALMKAIKAQIMGHSFYPQLTLITKLNYKRAMKLIKQLY